MTELSTKNSASIDAERRSNPIRALLITLALTPLLILPEPVRNIVSVEATAAAVTIGIITGIMMDFVQDRFQFESQNDVRTTVVALISTGIVTILLWILIPTELFQTVSHFALAFLWSLSLVSVTRHLIWPKAIELANTHD